MRLVTDWTNPTRSPNEVGHKPGWSLTNQPDLVTEVDLLATIDNDGIRRQAPPGLWGHTARRRFRRRSGAGHHPARAPRARRKETWTMKHEGNKGGVFSGLMVGVPLSILMWILLYLVIW